MARAPCWNGNQLTVRTLFVPDPADQRTREIVEKHIKYWLMTNITCPYMPLGLHAFLRARIVAELGSDKISDEEIEQCLDEIRDKEWATMVYRLTMVPVYNHKSGQVRAKAPEVADDYLNVEGKIYEAIPIWGKISDMAKKRENSPSSQEQVFAKSSSLREKSSTKSSSLQEIFSELQEKLSSGKEPQSNEQSSWMRFFSWRGKSKPSLPRQG